ncbi:MAG: glycoside hydrolase family 113 [Ktedonobacterales bacterium]
MKVSDGRAHPRARLLCLQALLIVPVLLAGCALQMGGMPTPTPTVAPLPTVTPRPSPTPGPYDATERGFDLIPASPDDYDSAQALQALQEIQAEGANYVTLTTTYNTDTLTSSVIHTGRYTASDESLATAITRAHLLGLQVNLTLYVDPLSGEWRANYNPQSRDQWFAGYAAILNHLAMLAQQYDVHRLCIGVELISLTTATSNPDNTAQWQSLIAGVRARYNGLVMYAANWGGSDFNAEYQHIAFWQSVDQVGIDAYYSLGSQIRPPVAQLEQAWAKIHDTVLVPFARQIQKPIIFNEMGYRSIRGASVAPSDSRSVGIYDGCEQANDYYAFLDAWKGSGLLAGVYWWYWETSTNVGGQGDTSFSPRFKPAQTILGTFWAGSDANADAEAGIIAQCAQQ